MVPNRFPSQPSTLRLALIGEAPGSNETVKGEPFVGASGRFLALLLSRAGTSRESCFLGNISQWQPPGNDFSTFSWDGTEVQTGLTQLANDLKQFQPNLVVLLGNVPLKAAKDPFTVHPLKPNAFRFKNANWRGSVFRPENGPFAGFKCLSTYHPAYVLRDYSAAPLLQFDLRKAVKHASHNELVVPQRTFLLDLSPDQLVLELDKLRKERKLVSLDIEGGIGTMSCVSFCNDPSRAFIVPFTKKDGSLHPSNQPAVWRAIAELLEDASVPKVLQNGLYDRFVLHYSYGIRIRGQVEDTMLKGWEIFSELEKGLAVQTSLYTDQPYYKGERKSQDDATFYSYCCMDSAVTLEICQSQDKHPRMTGRSLEHYRLNVELLHPMLYMELRGIQYNVDGAASRRQAVLAQMHEAQARLNGLTGHYVSSVSEIFNYARENMAKKRAVIAKNDFKGIEVHTLKPCAEATARLTELMHQANPTLATLGEVENIIERSMNVDSPMFRTYLYETLSLPPQYNEGKDGKPVLTADYNALIKLSKILTRKEDEFAFNVIQLAIEIRSLGTRAGMLAISADNDGRIRCGYNLVGSETGRVTCYTSPTGSGYNLQTIPKADRDLFCADGDKWFFQCDLSGADGWTVAAYCKMFGDPTMLDDYTFGLKPANILTLMLRGVAVDFNDRAALKAASKAVSGDDWDYFAMKRVQHGAAYLEGGPTISNNIFKDSEGKFYLPPNECKKLRDQFFFSRYPGIRMWHAWLTRRLRERPVLRAASGQERQFFGRPDEIITEAVAFEPQANTTYATNLAMHRLWTDKENRQNGSLKIEPLHQVHDALCGQFSKLVTPWAVVKINEWFDNYFEIAGQRIKIPFEGGYGPSWGNLKEGKI